MGFFSKKEKDTKKEESIPSLPELPKLPPLPNMEDSKGKLPQLPSFPKNSIGEKFSQDTIKKAINGRKEEEKETQEDELGKKTQMILESPKREIIPEGIKKMMRREIPYEEEMEKRIPNYDLQRRRINQEIPEGFEEAGKKIADSEPVFIRIDKFEESKKIFEKTKEQMMDIERALNRIKEIKQEEDRELVSWENEILNIKEKISKVEKDIFSKI